MKFSPPAIPRAAPVENLPSIIQGRVVGSKEEARLALAADALKWEYEYQVSLFQRSGVQGQIILDFLFYTRPLPTPVPVQSYWHTGERKARSDLQMEILEQETRGRFAPPKPVDGELYLQTIADARAWILQNLGTP